MTFILHRSNPITDVENDSTNLVAGYVVRNNAAYVPKKTAAWDIWGHSSMPDGEALRTPENDLVALVASLAVLTPVVAIGWRVVLLAQRDEDGGVNAPTKV